MALGRRFARMVLVGLALTPLVSGCGARKPSLTLAGSTAFQPFAEKLAGLYMSEHKDLNITVQGGGSALGIQSALSGAAQIGMADLAELPPEAKALTATVVARDGIAMVVNPANPVADLTIAQIRGIYNGAVRNWKELGGPDKPITVVSREEGSGTRTSFQQIVKDIRLTRDAIIQDSNGTIRETVANDPNAVGYLSHGILSEKIKALTVEGKACSMEEIGAGRYALVRPIYLLTRGEPAGPTAAFIAFILSDRGQKTLKDSGLLPAR